MSTYRDSKYVHAQDDYVCVDCDRAIPKGAEHLAFKVGQRRTCRVCAECSGKRGAAGALLWYCAATLARFEPEPA